MNVLFSCFALFGIILSKLVASKTYDFYKPDENLGKQEYFEHRGLKVYFFSPVYNSGVDKVVIGNQGVWTQRPGEHLSKVVGFFRCMGFGLSHVSYYTDDGKTKDLLLGYSHGDDDLVEVNREKFYTKLMDYTSSKAAYNPEVPGHPVLRQLEFLLKRKEETQKSDEEVVKSFFEQYKPPEQPVLDEAPAEEAAKAESSVPLGEDRTEL